MKQRMAYIEGRKRWGRHCIHCNGDTHWKGECPHLDKPYLISMTEPALSGIGGATIDFGENYCRLASDNAPEGRESTEEIVGLLLLPNNGVAVRFPASNVTQNLVKNTRASAYGNDRCVRQ